MEYIPDRYLDNEFGTKESAKVEKAGRRNTYTFGAGRRVCPGQHLGENSLVRLLCDFKIVCHADLS